MGRIRSPICSRISNTQMDKIYCVLYRNNLIVPISYIPAAMRWFLGTTLWINTRYCKVLFIGILYTVFTKRHRLKAARESARGHSNARAPTFVSSQNYEPDGPKVPPIDSLRGTICYGRRSVWYHGKHSNDPISFPAAGVCSRRRTKCKLYQARWSAAAIDLPVIPELPAHSHTTETESSLKKPLASL
jgi:hypothetical protein